MASEPSLLEQFLKGEIDNRSFRHADHIRVGFELLQRHDFSTAARAFSTSLKTIAAKAGNPGAYHETITVAFLAVIAERSAGCVSGDVEAFLRDNSDLMVKSVLERWYEPERLRSELARRIFLLPQPRN